MKSSLLPRIVFALSLTIVAVGVSGCGDSQSASGEGITIVHPENGEIVNESRFRVRGKASGYNNLTVNGEPVEVVGGEWNVLLDFNEGDATVVARSGNEAVERVDFSVDSHAPALTVTAPQRATYVESGEDTGVIVRGSVSDGGSGLQSLQIGPRVIFPDENGEFRTEVMLDEGINVVDVVATDKAGNQSSSLRGVMHGSFTDATSRIDDAINIAITPESIDTATQVVESILTPERTTQFVRQELEEQTDDIEVESIDFDNLDVNASPDSGVVNVDITVDALVVDGILKLSDDAYPVRLTMDHVVIETGVVLELDEEKSLSVEFDDPTLELEKEDFHVAFTDGDQPRELDNDTLRQIGVDLIKTAFGGLLNEQMVDRLYDPSVLNRRVKILGRELIFEVQPTAIFVRPDGIFFRTSIKMPDDRHTMVPQVPGALDRTPGYREASQIEADVRFRTNRRALDRLMHGVWRSGLLHQELVGSDFAGMELPAELNTGALAFALDGRIGNLAPDDAPAAVKLRPMLPPVARLTPQDDKSGIRLRISEFLVDLVVLPPDEPAIKVATVALFLDVNVNLGVEGVELKLGFDATVRADVAAEPEFDLDDRDIEQFVEGIGNQLPDVISENMVLDGEQDLTWIKMKNPNVEIHGADDDQVTVGLDLEPTPGQLEE